MAKVVVVGSYNQDFVWSSDEMPVPGATRLGTFASGPGGKGFNQAVAAARAGAGTVFITALGADDTAAGARALASAEGIDLRDDVHPGLATGTAGIFVDAAGRNVIVVAPGANAALGAGFVRDQADAFREARVVLAQLEVDADAVQAALDAAGAAGALAILNPAPANAATTDTMLAVADVLTPNETEFAAMLARHEGRHVDPGALATLPDAELHALCRALAPRATVVVTLGAAGAFVSHGEQSHGDARTSYRQPAHAANAIDTTGAGDAFNGALAAALATDPAACFADAVAFACRFAARSTERHGAALAMPRRTDLDD
ncbi:MAG TPA: PfkB family carbohydrate kinase [Arenimonas sp.]|uniref:PfkB family carbohydrate kinase n=1 Tax=Arenimonas sp. TaxID=1872635 RepID=UPI002D7E6A96|nr:PfkB family carbohydrate kinase [Arenimonas sp.]HEU0153538.1 PfkB family carbohydrate kinase [Arenimonas sp.]